jgi:two-component system response regulator
MGNGVIDILLIEDDPDDAELTIHALRKHRLAASLVHVDDGEKALEYLFSDSENLPRLILLDLRMPRVDGIQILRALKSDETRRSIPVVAMLSSRDGKSYVESFQLRADAYLVKPLDYKKFFAALTDLGMHWNLADTLCQTQYR